MTVSKENKALAAYLRTVFGGTPSVFTFWDEDNRSSVDIMTTRDSPEPGVSSYATLGLSDTSIGQSSDGIPLRVELLLVSTNEEQAAPQILASSAFTIINSKQKATPGAIFSRVIELYLPESDMKHILLAPPFLWKLETQEFSTKKVAWLLAVPISDKEMKFAAQKGSDALEDLLQEKQANIFDPERKSVC